METQTRARPHVDGVLETVVDLHVAGGASFAVTIYVGGGALSGDVISTSEFYELMAEGFAEGWEKIGADGDQIRNAFRANMEPREGDQSSGTAAMLAKLPAKPKYRHIEGTGYLHLKNVGYLGPDGQFANFPWWRGHLDRIDGWTLGRMSRS